MSPATREAAAPEEVVRSTGLRNLYQRLAAVTGAVGQIKATGRTRPMRGAPDGKPALSIEDVEDALRDTMAEHGVVSGYRWNAPPTIVGTLGEEGNVSLWQADLTVWLVNADNPDDRAEDHIYDIGTSPSAAVSFALKRYYRALFHLADAEDETRTVGEQRTRPPVQQKRPATKSAPVAEGEGDPKESRKDAIGRLNKAFIGAGLTRENLRDKARAMFGRPAIAGVVDLSDQEVSALADEVEALVASTGGKP